MFWSFDRRIPSVLRIFVFLLLGAFAAEPTFKHYETLEINKTATKQEVKSAYRKMSLKWHPDKNPDDVEGATVKFREVANAYEVLSDDSKRSSYDKFGDAGFGGMGDGDMGGMDPFEMFKDMFKDMGGGPGGGFGGMKFSFKGPNGEDMGNPFGEGFNPFGGMGGEEGPNDAAEGGGRGGKGRGPGGGFGGFGGGGGPFGGMGGMDGPGGKPEKPFEHVQDDWNGLVSPGNDSTIVAFLAQTPGKGGFHTMLDPVVSKTTNIMQKLSKGWKSPGLVNVHLVSCDEHEGACRNAIGEHYSNETLPHFAYYSPWAEKGPDSFFMHVEGNRSLNMSALTSEQDLKDLNSNMSAWIEKSIPDKTVSLSDRDAVIDWAKAAKKLNQPQVLFFASKNDVPTLVKSLTLTFQDKVAIGVVLPKNAGFLAMEMKIKKTPAVVTIEDASDLKVEAYTGKLKGRDLKEFIENKLKPPKESNKKKKRRKAQKVEV